MIKYINVIILSLFSLCFLAGCDGGLVGTSTGPAHGPSQGSGKPSVYVPRLPRKISPRLPDTIKKKSEGSDQDSQINNSAQVENGTESIRTESKSWSLISTSLEELDTNRKKVQELLALLDTEFDIILETCAPKIVRTDRCEIGDGEIKAVYNSDITQEMIAVYTTANADTPAQGITENPATSDLRNRYTALEGSTVVFNKLVLNLPTSTNDNFTITTSADDLLGDYELWLSWNSDYDQISYEVSNKQVNNTADRYHYRNSVSGQRLTIQRDLPDENGAPVSESFELTTTTLDNGEIYYNARIEEYHITGQATEESAFAYNRSYRDNDEAFFQEVFDEHGYLIEFDECEQLYEFYCEELDIEGEFYELFNAPEELELAYSELGFIEFSIVGLPENVEDFLILANNPELPLWLREELCEGWQPVAGEIELFCFVPDVELEDAIIVSADGEELELLPFTEIVWIED